MSQLRRRSSLRSIILRTLLSLRRARAARHRASSRSAVSLGPLVVTAAVAGLALASSGVALAAALAPGGRGVPASHRTIHTAHSVASARAVLRVTERLGAGL